MFACFTFDLDLEIYIININFYSLRLFLEIYIIHINFKIQKNLKSRHST